LGFQQVEANDLRPILPQLASSITIPSCIGTRKSADRFCCFVKALSTSAIVDVPGKSCVPMKPRAARNQNEVLGAELLPSCLVASTSVLASSNRFMKSPLISPAPVPCSITVVEESPDAVPPFGENRSTNGPCP